MKPGMRPIDIKNIRRMKRFADHRNPFCYWLIRTHGEHEPLGIVWTVSRAPGLSKNIVKTLNEAIGHKRWWFDEITKAQFTTYREFGFEVYTLGYE